ncbi:MAG TPA: HEAT repeat domain-containing protein [Kofleriaceae bacterium]|jgi:hypothetical protein
MNRLFGACALVGALGGVASAAPVATASEDVDGDNKPEQISVDANGAVSIGGKQVATLGTTVTTATVQAGRPHGTPTIVVSVDGKQAFILTGPAWKIATKTDIGGVGLDADFSTAISLTSIGPVKYQTRPGLHRCDGKPPLLFGEGFNGSKWGRLSRLPTEVDERAPLLKAGVRQGIVPPGLYRAAFASHEPGAADVGGLVAPAELVDGKLDTQWHEELSSSGEGQLFTFEPQVPGAKAKTLLIVPGNPTSAKALKESARPTRIAIVGQNAAYHVDIPDPTSSVLGTVYEVDLPTPIDGCATVIIEDTSAPKGVTMIAELSVLAEGEKAGGAEPMLAHLVATDQSGRSGEQQLVRGGAAAVAAIASELQTADAKGRVRLIAVLAQINDPTAAQPLMGAINSGWIDGAPLIGVVHQLAALHQSAFLATLAGNPRIGTEARIEAIDGVEIDAAGTTALIALAGQGNDPIRKALIERLSNVASDQLLAAAAQKTDAVESGDIWRAAVRRGRAVPAERATVLAAVLAALPTATDYDRRYRLIDGVAELGDAGALHVLSSTLAALPADNVGAALRQVAVDGLAKTPRPEAAELLATLASDSDPGVRLAAVRSLRAIENDAAGPWHVAKPDGIDRVLTVALANDHWPEVRREAASVLGTRCQRQDPRDALVASVGKDKNKDVKNEALDSLVTCKAAGIAALLEKTWSSDDTDIDVRTHAVRLAGKLEDPALGVKLVGRFTQWRSDALESEAALALAQASATAIAQLDAPGAGKALIDALYDDTYPEIVRAAADALGTMGKKCPAAALPALQEVGASGSDAAAAAARAAKLCHP